MQWDLYLLRWSSLPFFYPVSNFYKYAAGEYQRSQFMQLSVDEMDMLWIPLLGQTNIWRYYMIGHSCIHTLALCIWVSSSFPLIVYMPDRDLSVISSILYGLLPFSFLMIFFLAFANHCTLWNLCRFCLSHRQSMRIHSLGFLYNRH